MNINKIVIVSSIIVMLLLLVIPTTYKVVKNHQDVLHRVVDEKIIGAAKKCYYEKKCVNEKILLKDLYALDYLESMSDPVSKEYYNENSYVERKDAKFKFVVVE